MATKNFKAMTTKKLNALLETANDEDKALIAEVLASREQKSAAPTEAPLTEEEEKIIAEAEKNGGINPAFEGKEAGKESKKMTDQERSEIAKDLREKYTLNRCRVVPFNTVEWVEGYITGVIEDKRSNKVLYSIKLDDGRRIVKNHTSKLIEISDEKVEIEKVKAVRAPRAAKAKTEEQPWEPEQIEKELADNAKYVGCNISYVGKKIEDRPVTEEDYEHGRIISLVADKRGRRILFRIELNQTQEEIDAKMEKKFAHKVSTLPGLKIDEEKDEIGEKMNDAYLERRSNKRVEPLTDEEKVQKLKAGIEEMKAREEKLKKSIEAKEEQLKQLLSQIEANANTQASESVDELA